MKRASYRDAIDFIAYNDSPADDGADIEAIKGLATVVLIASIFDVDSDKVAADVANYRIKNGICE